MRSCSYPDIVMNKATTGRIQKRKNEEMYIHLTTSVPQPMRLTLDCEGMGTACQFG